MKTTPSPLRPLAIFQAILTAFMLLAPGFCLAAAAPVPAPTAAPKAAQTATVKPHVLAPTEEINISVEGEPELLKKVAIDEKGEVDLYLIGKIKVAGLTVEQANLAIQDRYKTRRFLRNPKVSMSLERQVIHTVTVLGQVKKTGKIIIPSDQDVTIVDVIILVDGFVPELARQSGVTVTRILEDGTQKRYEDIDVGSMLTGKKDRKDALIILPGDIINVPTRIF